MIDTKAPVKLDVHDVTKIEIREHVYTVDEEGETSDKGYQFKTVDIVIKSRKPDESQSIIMSCFMKRMKVHVKTRPLGSVVDRVLECGDSKGWGDE